MTIQPQKFATTSLRASPRFNEICHILAAAINSADAGQGIINNLYLSANKLLIAGTTYDLNTFKRIFIIGAGKAVVPMASAVSDLLGNRITSGVLITKDGYVGPDRSILDNHIEILEAGHPIPDHRNLDASSRITSLYQNLHNDDLVVCLISGGGSSLLVKPSSGLSLKDIQDTTALLLRCGATIDEINTVRKHMDELKGGGLSKFLYPATVLSLLLSDVIGDRFDVIASGPLVADQTFYKQALAVLGKYQISDQVPRTVLNHLSDGLAGKIPETLKLGDLLLAKVHNILVGSNSQTVSAAIQAAQDLGFTTSLLANSIQGEAFQVGQTLAERSKLILTSPEFVERPVCLIAGGETTVTVKGTGRGGRNQELALGAVCSLSGLDPIILISLATDGGDGPTDAAGAVVTNQTYSLGLAKGLDPAEYLQRNDSYHYFEPLGDLIKTGPTLTNVNDLVFIFRG